MRGVVGYTRGRSLAAIRVCRAWHRAGEVEVLTPGIRGAKG
jgi:hypothetical protein